jgi:hypothetical protein
MTKFDEILKELRETEFKVQLTQKGADAINAVNLQVPAVCRLLGAPIPNIPVSKKGDSFVARSCFLRELEDTYGTNLWDCITFA